MSGRLLDVLHGDGRARLVQNRVQQHAEGIFLRQAVEVVGEIDQVCGGQLQGGAGNLA